MEDPVPKCIGNIGKWQIIVGMMMTLLKFLLSWNQYIMLFYSPKQNFWCNSLGIFENDTHNDQLLNKCEINSNVTIDNITYQIEVKCSKFIYDTSLFTSTIVSEWDLVCDKSIFVELSQIIVLAGFTVGSLIFGLLADRYGRRKPLLFVIIVDIIGEFGVTYCPWYNGFLTIRFIIAICSGGIAVISFVICMEIFSGKWRTIFPIVYQLPIGIGKVILTGIAYFIRDWRSLQGSVAYISLLYFGFIWWIPESPRWLLATNRKQEALSLLQKIVKINGRTSDPITHLVNNNVSDFQEQKGFDRQTFKRHILGKKTFFLWIVWLCAGISVYGLVLNVGNYKNLFLTLALAGLSILPCNILCVILANYLSRKKVIYLTCLISAICAFVFPFIPNDLPHDWLRILLTCVIITNLGICLPVLFIYTGELYPTVIRNSAVGLATIFSRLGGCLSPFLVMSSKTNENMPTLICGVLFVISAFCIYPIPETKGRSLIDGIKYEESLRVSNNNTKFKEQIEENSTFL